MANFEFDVDEFLKGLDFTDEKVRKGAKDGMVNAVNDLARTAGETAPHDYGVLGKSYSTNVDVLNNGVIGEVSFSVKEGTTKEKDGKKVVVSANYALLMHEMSYKLGEGSLAKPGGTGMSGNHYTVGNKYLERPLKGESDTYRKHIAETIWKELT